MKKIISLIIISFLLVECNSHSSNKDSGTIIKTDSTVSVGIIDLTSTTSISTLICQQWNYKEDQDDIDNSDGTGDMDLPLRSFSFFGDSTVVKNPHGDIHFGQWAFNTATKIITIKYDAGQTEKYKIRAIGSKDMVLTKVGEGDKKLVYVADGKQEQNYADDPFYISNNRWRIKPSHPETTDAIKERLRQCIHFYAVYFADNVKRNASTIAFYGLPSCFTWYSGGISVKNEDKLKSNWLDIFYDNDQAMQAQSIMENLLTKKYAWDTTETNWVKQSAPVLQQMSDSLK